MDGVSDSRPNPWGYVLVLAGVGLFVVACFLPYYSVQGLPRARYSPSLYEVQTFRQSGSGTFGGMLLLFAGPTALTVAAAFGIGRARAWTATATTAMSIVWVLTWTGILLSGTSLVPPEKEIGYWLLLVAVGVVAVGAIVVAVSYRRTEAPGPQQEAEAAP